MRLVLFLAVWGWEGTRGDVDMCVGSSLGPGHSPSVRGACQLDAQLWRGGPSGLAFAPLPAADAHLGHRWNRGGARECVPVSLHPRGAGAGLGSAPQWEMLPWALVPGLSLLSPSPLSFPSVSTRKDQCTTCSSAASPLCFMAT